MSLTAEGIAVRGLLRSEYDVLVEQGVLDDQHVELIEGELVELSPIGSPPAFAVRRLIRLLVAQVAEPWIVGVRRPFPAGPRSEPQPDLAVVLDVADVLPPAQTA